MRITKQKLLEAEYRLTGRMPVGLRVKWKEDKRGLHIGTFVGKRTDGEDGFVVRAPEKVLLRERRHWMKPHPNCWFVDDLEYLEPYEWWGRGV